MKHLLSAADLSHEQALKVLDTVEAMAMTQSRQVKKLPTLREKITVNLSSEDSTRARTSSGTAVKWPSADAVNFSAKGSSVSKGESLKDTALALQAIRANGIVTRHRFSGAAYRLVYVGWSDMPVINAGGGNHQHPTQALLDAMTLRRHYWGVGDGKLAGKDLKGAKVVIVGDILHSQVARLNVDLIGILGAQVTLAGLPTLMPVGVEDWNCGFTYDFDTALNIEPDAMAMPRAQNERMSVAGGGFSPSVGEYHRVYGLDRSRFERLFEKTVIMHPGPMNRGMEICVEAVDSPQPVVVEQVGSGVNIRMSVSYPLLAPEGGLL